METFQVIYQVHASAKEIEKRAGDIALEQSVEVPLQAVKRQEILDGVVGKVENITKITSEQFEISIDFNVVNSGFEPAQFLNVLFGNVSLQPGIKLIDVNLPDSLIKCFGGPRFGMAGIRNITGAPDRPLTATALKPLGLSAKDLAELCRTFAQARIDIIKDDHGIADQSYASFEDRATLCQQAVDEVHSQTGHRTIYVPNMTGTPSALKQQAQIVQNLGVRAVMMAPMLTGMPVFHEIVSKPIDIPVMAHPAFAGSPSIAPELMLGKIFRLFGADISIFPNYGGRFSYNQQVCKKLADNLRQPWAGMASAFPVPAGGMDIERVSEMVRFYGNDVILLIGGSLLVADDVLAKSREFVKKVHSIRA